MDNRLKKYLIKTGTILLIDLGVAALIVLGYYWAAFRAPKKPVETQQLMSFEAPESTTVGIINTTEHVTETTANAETEIHSETNTSEETVEESTEETTPEATEPHVPTLREKFAEYFTAEPVVTENSYSDENVNIQISYGAVGEGDDRIVYQIADIHVADIRYFGSGIYNDDGTFQYECSPERFSMENPNAVLFINGDYCGFNTQGLIIRNGRLYRNEITTVEQCVLFADGSMKIFQPGEFTFDLAATSNVWQSWCFGPSLLNEDGTARTEFPHQDYLLRAHPRTALGYYEPGHYCFVTVDGREDGYSKGMTLYELSNLFANIGCKVGYNLDGGSSSCMLFGGRGVNHFTGRYMSDFILVSTTPLA